MIADYENGEVDSLFLNHLRCKVSGLNFQTMPLCYIFFYIYYELKAPIFICSSSSIISSSSCSSSSSTSSSCELLHETLHVKVIFSA